MITELGQKPNLHPEVLQKLQQVKSDFQSDEESKRIAQMANVNLEAKRLQGFRHLEELDLREDFERQAKKKPLKLQEASIKRKKQLIIAQATAATVKKGLEDTATAH